MTPRRRLPRPWRPSNYALRNRVAQTLGPIVNYHGGPKAGQPVAPDIESWFQKDVYQGKPHIVAQWADQHNSAAQGWVTADPTHGAYVDDWAKAHPAWLRSSSRTIRARRNRRRPTWRWCSSRISPREPGQVPFGDDHGTDGKR